jgi:hypothetical protein
MAAGFTGPLPDSLRALAALFVVLVLPAILLERHVIRARAAIASAPLRALFAFLSWLCILALWSAAFTVTRAPFHVFALATMWLMLALYALAAALPLIGRLPVPPARPWPRTLLLAVLVSALFAALVPPRLGIGDDSLDHIGYVRRVASMDSMRPAGVLAMPRDAGADALRSDPRKGALHPVTAFLCALSDDTADVVWRWLAVILFPTAAIAIVVFNDAFLFSRVAAWCAAFLVLLSFHGTPFRFAASSAGGESLAALWCWTMTALALATWQPGWIGWMLLAMGGVLVHMGVALHALVLAATVALLGATWGMTRAQRVRASVSIALGVAAALALRAGDLGGRVNPIHAHTQGVLFVEKQWFVASPMEILRLDGMLFLGGLACLPLVALLARTRRDARAVLAAAVIPLVVSFVPWVATTLFRHGSYMVFRSLLNIPVYAAIVVCASWLFGAIRARRAGAMLVGIPAAMVWLVVFARPLPHSLAAEARAQVNARHAGVPVSLDLEDAASLLPTNAVILSDPATSYALSALTSQRFVAVYGQHANPRDPYALDRLQAVRDVLSPYATPSAAVNACKRFGVNYVIVNGAPPGGAGFMPLWSRAQYRVTRARMAAMGQAFAFVDSMGGASIYRFEPTAPVSWSWAAQDQPVSVASLKLAPCEVPAPAHDFTVTGISVLPDTALPGDTVQVTLGYHHDAPSVFALPVVMHVRFDHDTLDRAREVPGEKIARRISDGRAHLRSRFRADLVPGHGVYEPDLWPAGFDLCETFRVVVPPNARNGHYHVRVALAYDTLVPNFHLRDLLYNRDHYSGASCTTLMVTNKITPGRAAP